MIISKKKGEVFSQNLYDQFFRNIEYNLRELGFGDVSVNSKMKEFNKILYDIVLKLEINEAKNHNFFKLNLKLVEKYFDTLNTKEKTQINHFEAYFRNFYNYCFEINPKNMLKELKKFKY